MAATFVTVATLALLTGCAESDSLGKTAELQPAAPSAAADPGGPDDLSHHTEEIDGVTHHMNKPPEPSSVDDYSALRPEPPEGVSYQREVTTVFAVTLSPEEAERPASDDLKVGWLATDDQGCAWYVDLTGEKAPLFGLEGTRVHERGVTLGGNFGEVHVDVGGTIAGEGRVVNTPAGDEECYGPTDRGFLAMPYPN